MRQMEESFPTISWNLTEELSKYIGNSSKNRSINSRTFPAL